MASALLRHCSSAICCPMFSNMAVARRYNRGGLSPIMWGAASDAVLASRPRDGMSPTRWGPGHQQQTAANRSPEGGRGASVAEDIKTVYKILSRLKKQDNKDSFDRKTFDQIVR